MTLIVLAAGMGSRYGGLKQIDPVGPNGEFIIDYSCHDAVAAGFDHIVFVIKQENYDIFRSTIGKRVEPFVKVSYAFQDPMDIPAGFTYPEGRIKPWGTTHAVLACRDIVCDNFATVNADDFYGRDAFNKVYGFMSAQSVSDIPSRCCMVAYKLKNTLTENGSVARGICNTDAEGKLVSITERTAINALPNGDGSFEENGNNIVIPGDTSVSMNLFGCTPAIFDYALKGFEKFLSNMDNPLKNEYYLPFMLSDAMRDNYCTIDVKTTDGKWFGVTYAADKPSVKANIADMISKGEYRTDLWSDLK